MFIEINFKFSILQHTAINLHCINLRKFATYFKKKNHLVVDVHKCLFQGHPSALDVGTFRLCFMFRHSKPVHIQRL
jgi:hypothetical protein